MAVMLVADEIIVSVDPITGVEGGGISRRLAHEIGLWHLTLHVWVLDAAGDVVLQQRSPRKTTHPLWWDVSVGGHRRVGEGVFVEAEEELGLIVDEQAARFVGRLPVTHHDGSLFNNELADVYVYESAKSLAEFTFPDDEVSGLASVAPCNARRFVSGESVVGRLLLDGKETTGELDGRLLVPYGAAYWERVFAVLGL